MDRPNFYVLLGLDPSVSDRARIEEAIARKKKEWNAMRNNSLTGPSAAKYLAMLRDIEDVLMNEQSRRQEADEARRELEAKRREAADELDRDIRVLSAKGYIYEKELQGLISQYKKKGFAEKDVRGRVRVSVRPEVQVKRHIKPSMEKAIFDLIVSCLTRLNKKDLYHFLDMSPTASGKRLLDATRDLDSKERKKNPTPDVTDRLKACGFCLSVFSTDDGRQRYDNTLERQNLRGLDRILQTIALTKDGFKPKVVQELMSQACEKGVDQDEAIAYIVDFAASKNLPITDPRESLSDGLQRCGNCGVINPTKDNLCGHCGSPLQVTCPKCKTTNASERRACSKCGFTVGDFFLVNRWLGDAERAIAREDFDTAMPLLQRVDALWPGEKKTASLLAKVAERKKRIDDLHKTVLKLTNARRYEEAQRELANLQALSQANPDIGRLASEIEGARSVARQHVDVG
jgi:hypothetical protein